MPLIHENVVTQKIRELAQIIQSQDPSKVDGRVRAIVLTKLEEAELWSLKIEKEI